MRIPLSGMREIVTKFGTFSRLMLLMDACVVVADPEMYGGGNLT
jgi:hypothetical protein